MKEVQIKNKMGEINSVVGVDTALNIPYFSWHGYIDIGEIKAACEKMLEYVAKSNADCYLSDNREATGYSDEMTTWTSSYFVPKLKELGIKKHAIIFPSEVFASISTQEFEESLSGYFQAKVFNSPEDAKKWLVDD